MKWLFWGAVSVTAYTYAGYPAWLWLRSHWRHMPVKREPCKFSVSVVMVVRNEDAVLERKLRNLAELEFPSDEHEVIAVSDGSTDGTNKILSRWASSTPSNIAILNEDSAGKASGLNDAMKVAKGDLIVFTDARQQIELNAVCLLAENFADPQVGCASGELMLGEQSGGENGRGMGLYWRMEKQIREMESASGSVIGATGALYAARRNLLAPVPSGTILDDVYIPMNVARQRLRVIFDGRARAWDAPNLGTSREFSRKVRTLSGNYQLVQAAPWLLGGSNPLRFEFVCHKLLRLIVPFALGTALISSGVLIAEPLYRFAFLLQVGFYTLSLLAIAQFRRGPLGRIADTAFTFVVLNTAAVVAFANFVTGKKAAWIR